MFGLNRLVQASIAIFCVLVVATAERERLGEVGASVGDRRLKSSGGIGAFSPPAPGFSRTGNSLRATAGFLPALVTVLVTLFF